MPEVPPLCSSVFGVEDVVALGRCPRPGGCTLLLILPEEGAAEWKAVEEVGGFSRVVNRWEQAGGRMDLTGMHFSGVYLGHIEEGEQGDELDLFEVKPMAISINEHRFLVGRKARIRVPFRLPHRDHNLRKYFVY